MSHNHEKVVCSKCRAIVRQCRCIADKKTAYVDGCFQCSGKGEVKVADHSIKSIESVFVNGIDVTKKARLDVHGTELTVYLD